MRLIAFWQPLRRRLPLLITALLFVAVAASSWLAYRQLAHVLVAEAGERTARVSARLASALAASGERMRLDERQPRADSVFARFLGTRDAGTMAQARAVLQAYRNSSATISAVELWTSRGERALASELPGFRSSRLDAAPVTGMFASPGVIGPLLALGDTVFAEFRRPVLGARGDTVGFMRQIQRVADEQSGPLVRNLIGPDAVLVVGNTTGDVWTDLSQRVPAPPHARTLGVLRDMTAPDGTAWVAASSPVTPLPWVVRVAIPRASVLAPARALLGSMGLFGIIILTVGALGAWLFSRQLTRPLDEVIAAAERISRGDYSHRVAVRGSDEMGQLAATFNTMTDQVQHAAYDLEAQQLELELANQELAEAVDRADLTASELLALVDGAPLGVCTLAPDGTVLSWNPAAERMFGWTAPEAMGQLQPSVAPAGLDEFHDIRRRLLAGERMHGRLVERRRKDGTSLHVSLSAAALRDSTGAVTRLLVMFEDVTDGRRMQAQLGAERRFMRQVIDINPNFMFAKDRDGRFTMANKAVADAYGTSTDDMLGKSDADFTDNAAEVEAFRAADREVIDFGRTKIIPEESITDATGTVRWLHTVKRPIIGQDGHAIQMLGVSTDITERKQLEAQLLQSQKMEAVGQLAGGVAHDFNNVLTAIKGFSELIALDLEADSPIRSDVAEITAAADRAASLTQQLLAFSRRQLLQAVVLSPNAVVEGVTKLLHRLIGAEVRCETRLASDVGAILADPGQLEQVLVNLVVNARDAMPDGGTVTIATANVVLDEAHAARLSTIEPATPGDYVMISVRDTGTGMSEAIQAHVFEPFFTTKAPGQGTGLGLSTVYGIARQSGGHVTVESEPGHGTVFRVYLPSASGELTGPVHKAAGAATQHGTETILLVDDDASVLTAVSRILTRAGYTVLTSSSPRESEAVWTEHAGPIHLLMTDVMMPDMDGGALARRLLAARPDTRVLYTSGYTSESVIGRGLITPDTMFLAKPFTVDAIVRKVRETLAA